tara:strand:+ start:105 stop:491 length:387 start_codon:yes stop_codon:yes gene_type:complete
VIGTPWSNIFFVEIVDYVRTETSSIARWTYDVKQVVFQNPASDKPEIITVGDVKTYKAFNVYEYSNNASYDMGISISSLPGDYRAQVIPAGTVVPAFTASGDQTDTSIESGTMIMLLWPNQFDGTCDE